MKRSFKPIQVCNRLNIKADSQSKRNIINKKLRSQIYRIIKRNKRRSH